MFVQALVKYSNILLLIKVFKRGIFSSNTFLVGFFFFNLNIRRGRIFVKNIEIEFRGNGHLPNQLMYKLETDGKSENKYSINSRQ